MEPIQIVSFIVTDGRNYIAEQRKSDNKMDAGLITIPGGHMNVDETFEQTLFRESGEELGITPLKFKYVCSLPYKKHNLMINYFVVTKWSGTIVCNEAERLHEYPIKSLDSLSLDCDREAVNIVLKNHIIYK